MTGHHSGRCYLRGNLNGEVGAELDPKLTVLPEVFQAAGYTTGCFGKWGMGPTHLTTNANPLKHGIDEFYGWKSQTIAHTYYPSTLVHNGKEIPVEEGKFVHDLIMDQARNFISTAAENKQPFFCYIPTAVPHAAMHAPPELHAKWRQKLPQFDSKVGKYRAGDEDCPDVQNPIAGFGAMMENLDNEVGLILTLLKTLKIDEDTIVMFSSDNGAHKEGGHDPMFWNSTGGLRGFKRDMHEGGIRAPLLARWPGTISPGTTSDHISSFQDILPTMAELTKQPTPSPCDGISMLPTLVRSTDKPQQEHDFLYWEFCKGKEQKIFSTAIRKQNWKAYHQVGKPMELFDLSKDPFETNNIAKDHSDIIQQMKAIEKDSHFPLPARE